MWPNSISHRKLLFQLNGSLKKLYKKVGFRKKKKKKRNPIEWNVHLRSPHTCTIYNIFLLGEALSVILSSHSSFAILTCANWVDFGLFFFSEIFQFFPFFTPPPPAHTLGFCFIHYLFFYANFLQNSPPFFFFHFLSFSSPLLRFLFEKSITSMELYGKFVSMTKWGGDTKMM